MCIVIAIRDRQCRLLYGCCHIAFEQTEFGIGAGGGPFDMPKRRNELTRHGQSTDREVLDSSLRLGAPQRVLRDFKFAHAVSFGAKIPVAHCQ